MGGAESRPHVSKNEDTTGRVSAVRATDFSAGKPPNGLRFHSVHGRNIRLSQDRKVAERVNSFCYGISFSDRPIHSDERVRMKLKIVESAWSGVMRFGVTSNDPSSLDASTLPRYACPDLTNQIGYWAKALPDDFAIQGNVLSFYVNYEGNLCLSLNDEEQGTFIGGIPTNESLWVMADIYGNTTALEFLDNEPTFSLSRNLLDYLREIEEPSTDSHDVDENEIRSIFNISPFQRIKRIAFSATAGEGVDLSHENSVASLGNVMILQSCLIFSGEPLKPGSSWYLKVLHANRQPFLSVGVTSCDPSTLSSLFLPLHANTLVDRPEYWAIEEMSDILHTDDLLCISLNPNGFITYRSGNNVAKQLFYCDVSQPLWIIIDLSKNVERIISIGMIEVSLPGNNEVAHSSSDETLPPDLEDSVGTAHVYSLNDYTLEAEGNEDAASSPEFLQSHSPGLVLVDSDDEEGEERRIMYRRNRSLFSSLVHSISRISRATRIGPPADRRDSSSSDEYFNTGTDSDSTPPLSDATLDVGSGRLDSGESGDLRALSGMTISSNHQPAESSIPTSSNQPNPIEDCENGDPSKTNECAICCEAVANAAIYDCGHVCLCLSCGVRLVNSQRHPKCPICRNPIKDIMKLYHV